MVDTFNSIKSNAMGSDDVNLRMLLLVIPYLSDHLTYIINKCLSTGTFPNVWKEAYVIPVTKTSNPSSTSDVKRPMVAYFRLYLKLGSKNIRIYKG